MRHLYLIFAYDLQIESLHWFAPKFKGVVQLVMLNISNTRYLKANPLFFSNSSATIHKDIFLRYLRKNRNLPHSNGSLSLSQNWKSTSTWNHWYQLSEKLFKSLSTIETSNVESTLDYDHTELEKKRWILKESVRFSKLEAPKCWIRMHFPGPRSPSELSKSLAMHQLKFNLSINSTKIVCHNKIGFMHWDTFPPGQWQLNSMFY